jgi:hypothetical protein
MTCALAIYAARVFMSGMGMVHEQAEFGLHFYFVYKIPVF